MIVNDVFRKVNQLENSSLKEIDSFKLNYAIDKNIKLMNEIVEFARKEMSKVPNYFEYYKVRNEIELKLKDAEPEVRDELIKEFTAHNEANKETIDAIEKVLNDESDFEYYTVLKSKCPDKLSSINTKILFDIIVDDDK